MYIPNPSANTDRSGMGAKSPLGQAIRSVATNGQHHYRPTNNNQYKGFVFFGVYNLYFPNLVAQTQRQYGGIMDRSKMPQYQKPAPY